MFFLTITLRNETRADYSPTYCAEQFLFPSKCVYLPDSIFSLKPAFPRCFVGTVNLTYKGGGSLMTVSCASQQISLFLQDRVLSDYFPQSSPPPYSFLIHWNCHCEMFGLGLVLEEAQRNVSVTSKYSKPLIQLFPLKIFLWTFSWIRTPAVNIFVSLLEWTPAIWSLWSPYLPQCSSPLTFPFLPPSKNHQPPLILLQLYSLTRPIGTLRVVNSDFTV